MMNKIFILFLILTMNFYPLNKSLFNDTINSNSSGILSPADTTVYDALPLQVGNKWIYLYYSPGLDVDTSFAEIVGDTILSDNNLYYKFNFDLLPGSSSFLVRCDSGNIYFVNGWDSSIVPVLKFTAQPRDEWEIQFPPYSLVRFGNIDSVTMFSEPARVFEFGLDGIAIARIFISPEFGFTRIEDYGDNPSAIPSRMYVLQGCVLSGTVYGNVVSVNEDKVTPEVFNLGQNYPNPFNSLTSINYNIPQNDFVSVILYDLLGREVKTIEQGYRNAGSYKIQFDAAGLSSGTYFYRIVTGSYTDTKKLIYLK